MANPTQSDKATRAAASLKEREEQVRIEKEKSFRSTNAARGAMGREEGEREFRTLLTDVVRDHEVSFLLFLLFLFYSMVSNVWLFLNTGTMGSSRFGIGTRSKIQFF